MRDNEYGKRRGVTGRSGVSHAGIWPEVQRRGVSSSFSESAFSEFMRCYTNRNVGVRFRGASRSDHVPTRTAYKNAHQSLVATHHVTLTPKFPLLSCHHTRRGCLRRRIVWSFQSCSARWEKSSMIVRERAAVDTRILPTATAGKLRRESSRTTGFYERPCGRFQRAPTVTYSSLPQYLRFPRSPPFSFRS